MPKGKRVVHETLRFVGLLARAFCGVYPYADHATTNRRRVTCRNCKRSMKGKKGKGGR